MLSAYDAQNRFVCYGTLVRAGGATYGVFPDDPDAALDDRGRELVAAKRSALYGFKMCPMPEREGALELAPTPTPRLCLCADELVLGFACWFAYKSGATTIRFVQFGDPRLNGAPVVDRASRRLVGMYLVRSWAEETKAECVPCDLFFSAPPEGAGWDPRREEGVRAEIAAGWGAEVPPAPKLPRALEVNDWVFAETHDRRARWVTHVYHDREFVHEDECRFLAEPFPEVVARLERGDRALRWGSGAVIELERAPRGVGFFLEFRPQAPAPEAPAPDAGEFPCVDWC